MTYISLISPPVNATTFELIMPLQPQQIRPIPTLTSSLVPLQNRAKYNTIDEQVLSSLPWSCNMKNKELKGWNNVIKTSSNNIYNFN